MKSLLKNLGPGLLFAGMAIGTSHLVLSTKAGAQYGWIMVFPIVLANVLKYPFFEFGVRYTSVTNKSLIQGYLTRGKTYLWLYAFITFITTFTVLAALYTVTAGLFMNLFKFTEVSLSLVTFVLFLFISALLIIGKYKFLELSLKFVVGVLFIALIITTILVLIKGKVHPVDGFIPPTLFDKTGILFLIALMGWMPTTVEASSWVSLWSIEKWKSQPKPSLRESLQEFNLGYIITAVLALFFMIIGWFTLYGTNTVLSNSAVAFADQVVQLFTTHIGDWAYPFIAISAFATMFSTSMTAHDAIARVSLNVTSLLSPKFKHIETKRNYALMVVALAVVNFMVVYLFSANMGNLVGLATFISFLFAPIIGFMNLKNVTSTEIPMESKPSKGLKALTYAGIIFLSCFSAYYFWIIMVD